MLRHRIEPPRADVEAVDGVDKQRLSVLSNGNAVLGEPAAPHEGRGPPTGGELSRAGRAPNPTSLLSGYDSRLALRLTLTQHFVDARLKIAQGCGK